VSHRELFTKITFLLLALETARLQPFPNINSHRCESNKDRFKFWQFCVFETTSEKGHSTYHGTKWCSIPKK